MNTAQELREQFAQLYNEMATSKDVAKMKHFGVGFSKMFDEVANKDPKLAMATLEFLSAMAYNNYVTATEAVEVASRFVNDDKALTGNSEPTKGPKWNMDTVKSFLSQRGIPLEEKPYYNWAALWLVMNMIYSDFANTLVDVLGTKDAEKIAVTCYKLAVARLKDLDRPHFVREYFDLDD